MMNFALQTPGFSSCHEWMSATAAVCACQFMISFFVCKHFVTIALRHYWWLMTDDWWLMTDDWRLMTDDWWLKTAGPLYTTPIHHWSIEESSFCNRRIFIFHWRTLVFYWRIFIFYWRILFRPRCRAPRPEHSARATGAPCDPPWSTSTASPALRSGAPRWAAPSAAAAAEWRLQKVVCCCSWCLGVDMRTADGLYMAERKRESERERRLIQ